MLLSDLLLAGFPIELAREFTCPPNVMFFLRA